MRVILIDYENIQPDKMPIQQSPRDKLVLLAGPHQKKMPIGIVKQLADWGKSLEIVQIKAAGKNNLDFHLVYCLSKMICQQGKGEYWIISKDKGFDQISDYIREETGAQVRREENLDALLSLKAPIIKSTAIKTPGYPNPRIQQIAEKLKKARAAKPKTQKTLRNFIKSELNCKVNEANALLSQLKKCSVITVSNNNKISYSMQ